MTLQQSESLATKAPTCKEQLEELHGKLKNHETLTTAEKKFLLYTGKLPYKAILFPETLTAAERNRIRYMPPPAEVTVNIQKITNGAMSTPEAVFQRALASAETMSDDELALIINSFVVPESVYEMTRRISWQEKLGMARGIAFNAVTTKKEMDAFIHATDINISPKRRAASKEAYLAKVRDRISPQAHEEYHANQQRLKVLAFDKERLWDEQDDKLFAEVAKSMKEMADALPDK